MDKPFPAYGGSEPYVFVCYAHKDAKAVYADLQALNSEGIPVWYDEGIPAGQSWRGEIATAIERASKLLFYVSSASLQSAHCLREIDFALNHDVEIIPVYLDNSALTGELELALSRVQALFRKSDPRYLQRLVQALTGVSPPGPPVAPPPSRRRQMLVGSLLVVMALAGFIVWRQWPTGEADPTVSATGQPASSAFDHYLSGLDMLERWDKDDNLESAIGLFRQATRLDPEFALAYARLADGLRIRYALTGDTARLEEASASVQKAMQLDAGLAPVQVSLGRILAMQGHTDLAFAALERAIALDPNSATANQAIASQYARVGRLEDAEQSFQKALALDPDSLSVRDAYANFLFRQSRFEDAASQWRAVIRAAPDHYAALVNLGSVLTDTGKVAEAIAMYQRANAIRPTYMGYSNLGTAYSRAGQYPDAVDAYKAALEIDDSDWLAWGNLGIVYQWMGGHDSEANTALGKAIELAESAREQKPRDAFSHSDLALYYARTGQPELALQRARTALTLSPDSGEILAAAAEVYELTGQREQAIALAHRALENGIPRVKLLRNPDLAALITAAGLGESH